MIKNIGIEGRVITAGAAAAQKLGYSTLKAKPMDVAIVIGIVSERDVLRCFYNSNYEILGKSVLWSPALHLRRGAFHILYHKFAVSNSGRGQGTRVSTTMCPIGISKLNFAQIKSMDDNCGEWVECMAVASGCGEQEVGVASGRGWNLWVWLVGVVVRRYIDFLILLIPTPLVSVLFCSSIPTFCSFEKMFFVLVPVLFWN